MYEKNLLRGIGQTDPKLFPLERSGNKYKTNYTPIVFYINENPTVLCYSCSFSYFYVDFIS